MTLEEFIEHLKLNNHLYYEEELASILNYLEELNVTRKAFELACKRLEILDKKLGGTCQLNSEQFHDSILKKARE